MLLPKKVIAQRKHRMSPVDHMYVRCITALTQCATGFSAVIFIALYPTSSFMSTYMYLHSHKVLLM